MRVRFVLSSPPNCSVYVDVNYFVCFAVIAFEYRTLVCASLRSCASLALLVLVMDLH